MDVHPLTQIQRAFEPPPTFLSQYLLLLPPSAQAIKPPGSDILQYLYDLALQANKAAESLSCSSILAGQGNESDDTGDVALWLGSGHYGPGQEQAVLRTLGLASWLDQGAIVGLFHFNLVTRSCLSTSRCPRWNYRLLSPHCHLPCPTVQQTPKSKIW